MTHRWIVGTSLLMLAWALSACTSHGRIGALPTVPTPTDAAAVIVIREWRYIGGGANLTVGLNGTPLYGIATSEHVVIPVPPGYHVVSVSPKGAASVLLPDRDG